MMSNCVSGQWFEGQQSTLQKRKLLRAQILKVVILQIYQLLIEKIDLNIQKGIAVSAIFIIL